MHLTSHLPRQHDTPSCIDINPQHVSPQYRLSFPSSHLISQATHCFLLALSSVVPVFHFSILYTRAGTRFLIRISSDQFT
jgi:hypothetical protein